MEKYIPYIIAGNFAVVVLIIAAVVRAKAKRKREFEQCAAQMGFSFNPAVTKEVFSDLSQFKLFSKGSSKRARNVLERDSHNIRCSIFDYSYTVHSGNSTSTYTQSVLCFRSPLLRLPYFILRPETVFDKIGSLVGMKDFDFDDTPEFSKKYVLSGEDEDEVRMAFNQELRRYFETHPHMHMEAKDDKLIIYRNARRIKPVEMREKLEIAFEIFNLLKSQ